MTETPNTVHGRLLEAVHISGYTFERAYSELGWLLDDDRWKTVGDGFDDINAFLGTVNLSEFRIGVEQRQKLARRLREIEASQRATARLLGVSQPTVLRALNDTNVSQPHQNTEQNDGENPSSDTNVSPQQPAQRTYSGEVEWYTPPEYIELARKVMTKIDLDPASSDDAQKIVQADKFLTVKDDGLKHAWKGRVWLNPPYRQPEISNFAQKTVDEVKAGNVSQAIMLTNNCTDTEWFHLLAGNCVAICFKRGRIKFINEGQEGAAPTNGQAFFYFGHNIAGFLRVFSSTGIIVRSAG
jgi:phage N-6-adenine-methyltransferase